MIGPWHCADCPEQGVNEPRGRDGFYYHQATRGHLLVPGERSPEGGLNQQLAAAMEAVEAALLQLDQALPQLQEGARPLSYRPGDSEDVLRMRDAVSDLRTAYWHGFRPDVVAIWGLTARGEIERR